MATLNSARVLYAEAAPSVSSSALRARVAPSSATAPKPPGGLLQQASVQTPPVKGTLHPSLTLPSKHVQNETVHKLPPGTVQTSQQPDERMNPPAPRPVKRPAPEQAQNPAPAKRRAVPPTDDAIDIIALTPDACIHLRDRDPEHDGLLTAAPIVRVLSLQRTQRGETIAFVTDGDIHTPVVFSDTLAAKIGDRDEKLHVGSAVKLTGLVRLPADSPYRIKVTSFSLIWQGDDNDLVEVDQNLGAAIHNPDDVDNNADDIDDDPDTYPLMVEATSGPRARTIDLDPRAATERSLVERIAQLTSERDTLVNELTAKWTNERNRRRVPEHALADVCRGLLPGVLEAMGRVHGLVSGVDFQRQQDSTQYTEM
ncbi:hypothetical protein BD413DRAFT_609926 [Trametes elegans]|nr:hypothetical protein BD413DRAFT_609926 [Trametes elegans]